MFICSNCLGYFDPPAGIKVDEGKAYNPYFPGGVIAMPQQLFDEGIEYKDGTPATMAQQAKDICTFLRWTSEHHHDDRKRWALKVSSTSTNKTYLGSCDYPGRHIYTIVHETTCLVHPEIFEARLRYSKRTRGPSASLSIIRLIDVKV